MTRRRADVRMSAWQAGLLASPRGSRLPCSDGKCGNMAGSNAFDSPDQTTIRYHVRSDGHEVMATARSLQTSVLERGVPHGFHM